MFRLNLLFKSCMRVVPYIRAKHAPLKYHLNNAPLTLDCKIGPNEFFRGKRISILTNLVIYICEALFEISCPLTQTNNNMLVKISNLL